MMKIDRRKLVLGAGSMLTGTLMAACTTGERERADDVDVDDVPQVADEAGDDTSNDEVTDDELLDEEQALEEFDRILAEEGLERVEDADVQGLDLETLQTETLSGTVQAEPYDNAFVGRVTDELYIGIALDSQYAEDANQVVVYMCDSDSVWVYLTGELEDGAASLSDEKAEVELLVGGSEITGTVALSEGEPRSFAAAEATGQAGMYAVTGSHGDINYWSRWIVLEDGSQRGFETICCTVVGFIHGAPIIVCSMCRHQN